MILNWGKYGIEISKVVGGKTYCPKCHSTRKNKHDKSLSVDKENGLFNCHNVGCDFKGSAADYKPKKEYVKPTPRLTRVSEKVVKYFETRGISNDTLLRFNITENIEWMSQEDKEVLCICFNYFRDGQLINIKYRSASKSFKMIKDAELIFYNLDSIKDETTAIITEGEIDCLTLHECGLYNSVSVPNGASKGNQRLEYLDNCYEYFDDKTKVILAVDSDEAGLSLREELARRLGKDKCYTVNYPEDCKDINETFLKHGKQALVEIIEGAKEYPMEGIITMDKMYPTIIDWYENGYPPGARTKIENFDKLLTFGKGRLTVVTGIPGHGKDEFVNLIMTRLTEHENWSWGVCGFEETPEESTTKLIEKFTGKSFNFRKDPEYRVGVQDMEYGIGMVDEYFSFIDTEYIIPTVDGILEKSAELVKKKGINGLVINPWNYIESTKPDGMNETEYINVCLTKIKQFGRRYNVHILLLAHTTKITKINGKYEVPVLYNISGCHDEETEVLTFRGWVKHNDLLPGDLIACFNPENEEISYQQPSYYHKYDYNGEMIHFHGKAMDILVTPNHRMIIKPHWLLKKEGKNNIGRTCRYNSRSWNFIEAKDISKSPLLIPKSGKFIHEDAIGDIVKLDKGYNTNLFFSLIGWYISEGWHTMGSIAICQADQNSKNIRAVFEGLKLSCTARVTHYIKSEKPMWSARILSKQHPQLIKFILDNCGIGSSNKKIPDLVWSAGVEQKKMLFDALIEGDGSVSRDGFKYNTCSKQLADDVSRLAFEIGYKTTQSFSKSCNIKRKDRYVVFITKRENEWLKPVNHKTKKYIGSVYCLTVPTGAYVTRRNGKVAITGNSAHWFNKTDNGLTIYRHYDSNMVEVHVQKVKQSWLGEIGKCEFNYDTMTRQYKAI